MAYSEGVREKGAKMTRQQIEEKILGIMVEKFEMENPGFDDDLREEHNFDSIDAIDLLASIEGMLGATLSDDEKRGAMEIRTIRNIIDYVEALLKARA